MSILTRNIQSDRDFGASKEKVIIDVIRNQWSDLEDIKKTSERYCPYDFKSKCGTTWELKARRNEMETYPTTIIPTAKLNKIESNHYFIFSFTDANAFIKYDKELFDTFNKKMVRYNRYGGNPNAVEHIEIPIHRLIKINN